MKNNSIEEVEALVVGDREYRSSILNSHIYFICKNTLYTADAGMCSHFLAMGQGTDQAGRPGGGAGSSGELEVWKNTIRVLNRISMVYLTFSGDLFSIDTHSIYAPRRHNVCEEDSMTICIYVIPNPIQWQ